MSKLLINEYPLIILPSLATRIGLNESVVLQQVHFWISKEQNFKNGRYWVYNTYEEWAEQFPFWSESTVRRTFNKLEKDGLLISDNFNKLKIDRTKWYSIDYEKVSDLSSNEQTS